MIEITMTDTEVRVKGHAGYAERGTDVVCAGVSAISQALLNWCAYHKEMADKFKYTAEDGELRLLFAPVVGAKRLWAAVTDMAYLGYKAIEAEYPQYVSVK